MPWRQRTCSWGAGPPLTAPPSSLATLGELVALARNPGCSLHVTPWASVSHLQKETDLTVAKEAQYDLAPDLSDPIP